MHVLDAAPTPADISRTTCDGVKKRNSMVATKMWTEILKHPKGMALLDAYLNLFVYEKLLHMKPDGIIGIAGSDALRCAGAHFLPRLKIIVPKIHELIMAHKLRVYHHVHCEALCGNMLAIASPRHVRDFVKFLWEVARLAGEILTSAEGVFIAYRYSTSLPIDFNDIHNAAGKTQLARLHLVWGDKGRVGAKAQQKVVRDGVASARKKGLHMEDLVTSALGTGNFLARTLPDGTISPEWVAALTRREATLDAISDPDERTRTAAAYIFAGGKIGGKLGRAAMLKVMQAGIKSAQELGISMADLVRHLRASVTFPPRKLATGSTNPEWVVAKARRAAHLATFTDQAEHDRMAAAYYLSGGFTGGAVLLKLVLDGVKSAQELGISMAGLVANARAAGLFPTRKLADGTANPQWKAAKKLRKENLGAIREPGLYARTVATYHFAGGEVGAKVGGAVVRKLVNAGVKSVQELGLRMDDLVAAARATGDFPPPKLADGSPNPEWAVAKARREAQLAAIPAADPALYARTVTIFILAGGELGGKRGGPAMNALVNLGIIVYGDKATLDAEAKALLATEAAKPEGERLFQLRKDGLGNVNPDYKPAKRERRRLLAAIADPAERLKRTALFHAAGSLLGARVGARRGGIASGAARQKNELYTNFTAIKDLAQKLVGCEETCKNELANKNNPDSISVVQLGKKLVQLFRADKSVDWWVATENECEKAKRLHAFLTKFVMPQIKLAPAVQARIDAATALRQLRADAVQEMITKKEFNWGLSVNDRLAPVSVKMLAVAQKRAAEAPGDADALALAADAQRHLIQPTADEQKQHKSGVMNACNKFK